MEAYLALKMMGVRPNEPHMQAARRFILKEGGVSIVGVTTQLLLALLGLVAWSELPQVPPGLMLLPSTGPFFSMFSLAYWARTAAIPIIVLLYHQPVYHGFVPTDILDHLWVNARDRHITYIPSLRELWHNGQLIRRMGNIADKTLGGLSQDCASCQLDPRLSRHVFDSSLTVSMMVDTGLSGLPTLVLYLL
jgi:hypothetical protein